MERLKKRQNEFLVLVTGGGGHYEGKSMKKAHESMVISKMKFNAFWENLEKSLLENGIDGKLVEEVRQIFYSMETDVVNEK